MASHSSSRFLECCCTTLEEVLEAQKGGADRIELCERLDVGGVTPSVGLVRKVLEFCRIPVNILVRPRGGDFVFTPEEIQEMLHSIDELKEFGINGVVIGALNPDGSVDIETMRRLIAAARPLPVTFHRAFDRCSDPLTAFGQIKALGCERLLTSGHEEDALTGSPLIAELVKRSEGRIKVMAGCGVRPSNIARIEAITHAPEYHSSSHGPDGTTSAETVSELIHNTL